MNSFHMRRQELAKREMQFKNLFIRCENFFRENDSKLTRAVKKAQEEIESQKQRQKEIDRLNRELDHSTKLKEKLEKKVDNHKKFHKYLTKVKFVFS